LPWLPLPSQKILEAVTLAETPSPPNTLRMSTVAAMVFEPFTAIIIVLVGVVTYLLYRVRAIESPHVSPPTAVESSTDYAKPMALSAARCDESYMKAVFERHKDTEGGLSKTALMAALAEVKAPVLSTREGNSEDDLFRRADSNLSGAVDLNEYVSRLLKSIPIAKN
jgi:hypothetical protein